jgi:uncharacterized protein (TIGR02271 family)
MAETAEVERRRVETRTVRIAKEVSERVEVVDEPLVAHEVVVERRPVNRIVDKAPAVRTEGDTTFFPVLEETLVIEKRLMLKEEICVTRIRHETRAPERVLLRTERARIDRIDHKKPPKAR